jgi:hypothetical protein
MQIAVVVGIAVIVGLIASFALGNALWLAVAVIAGGIVAGRIGSRARAEQQARAMAAQQPPPR